MPDTLHKASKTVGYDLRNVEKFLNTATSHSTLGGLLCNPRSTPSMQFCLASSQRRKRSDFNSNSNCALLPLQILDYVLLCCLPRLLLLIFVLEHSFDHVRVCTRQVPVHLGLVGICFNRVVLIIWRENELIITVIVDEKVVFCCCSCVCRRC